MSGGDGRATGPPRLALPGADDTIVALATAPGRAALAVVRLSGPRAWEVAGRLAGPAAAWSPPPRRACLTTLRDPETGEVLDRAVVTAYRGPASYTGEDAVEVVTHGGLVAPALVLRGCLAAGAREALPGEFTRRAVANGKLDLLQAEAVADLVDAGSQAAHRAALAQLDGNLSRRLLALRAAVVELEALIAYDLDFPEEDDGPVARDRVLAAAAALGAQLDALLATAPAGELVRAGAVVVLAGAPNVGKSSVFNALLGEARALVTEVPGTTRDAIEARIETARWPIRLVDTAGLRETSDAVERLGIEVSERYLTGAQLVLVCGEDVRALEGAAARVTPHTRAPLVAVRTKSDLVSNGDQMPASPPGGGASQWAGAVAVSALTGAGIPALLDAIDGALAARYAAPAVELPLLSRVRHRTALTRARAEVAAFAAAWEEGALPAPVAAVHLREAAHALEELVGTIDVEDVLDRVFAAFCVGK